MVVDLNRHYSIEDMEIVNKDIKKYLSLAIREMEIKTLMRCHYASTRMATIKKIAKYWQGGGEIRILIIGGNAKYCSCFEKQFGSS